MWQVSSQEEIWTYQKIPRMCEHRRETMWVHREKVALCKPERESSEETEPTGIIILDFWSPELWEKKLRWTRLPSLCYFVLAALTNIKNIFKRHWFHDITKYLTKTKVVQSKSVFVTVGKF